VKAATFAPPEMLNRPFPWASWPCRQQSVLHRPVLRPNPPCAAFHIPINFAHVRPVVDRRCIRLRVSIISPSVSRSRRILRTGQPGVAADGHYGLWAIPALLAMDFSRREIEKAMIDRNHELPVSRQAHEPGLSRGSVYYRRRPTSSDDLALMRRIDERIWSIPLLAPACCVTCWLGKAFGWAGCTSPH
jgi:hypothetical protein